MKQLRIAVLSTEGQGVGGAVRATRRLVAGLRMRGHQARLISLLPQRATDGIGIYPSTAEGTMQRMALRATDYLQQSYIDTRRTPLSNTFFSPEVAGYSFGDHSILDRFDIINIHWVARFLAPHTVAEIIARGQPVAYTLHDMAAFTGGCHYSAGCRRYREHCSPCPQITSDPLELTHWTLAQKRRLIPSDSVYVITPSHWLSACAAESALFSADRVFTIPNAVETEVFHPTDKRTAKTLLGIDPDVRTLVFGAENNREHRKGFDLLMETWNLMQRDPRMQQLLAQQRVRILGIGAGSEAFRAAGLPSTDLGTVRNDSRLALIYGAADLLILSSREDNLPNILLEAMGCATPVVAFSVGGIPDVIDDQIDGRLIPAFDLKQMALAATELLLDPERATAMGAAARNKIADRYPLDRQAAAYESLFQRMVTQHQPRKTAVTRSSADDPASISLPLTLNSDVARHPIGLFLEQQMRIDRLTCQNSTAEHELHRVHDVLSTATRELLASRSWRCTRVFRRSGKDPEITSETAAEQAAVTLLNLFRSKSWEISAPLRLVFRILNFVRRPFARLWRHKTSLRVRNVSVAPTLAFFSGGLPQPQENPSPLLQPGLNIICLHLYHLDLWDELKSMLKPVIGPETPLYLTLPKSNSAFIDTVYADFPEQYCKVFVLENRGLDVYPFLFIFDHLVSQGVQPLTLTKLHTKKSVHHRPELAAEWRRELYEGLLRHHAVLTGQFADKELGMVCSKKWWVNEDERSSNFQAERRVIESTCLLFGVSPTYRYLTGSMYIISFAYLEKLFTGVDRQHLLSQFEPGYQRSDTLAHGFERVVCYGLDKFALKTGLL